MKTTTVINSPIGKIGIICGAAKLVQLEILPDTAHLCKANDAFSKQVVAELNTYFENPKHKFNIEMLQQGTVFQQKVWQHLQKIPCGKTLTYGQVAKQLKTASRAIGQACRTNPITIIVPCHRIIGTGSIGGYGGARAGRWLEVKTWLLKHEGVVF